MDIIVTTPKTEIENAALEAKACIKNGGGYYFRRFATMPRIEPGERVFYVEDGYIRGFAVVTLLKYSRQLCSTTGREWPEGYYVFMDATTWRWIVPVAHEGFRGYKYFDNSIPVREQGNWLDPKPELKNVKVHS